ncbi:MAG: hypothetical protein KBA40_02220 [Candidatus Peribacteraceae bacterium]|nr:hypothetical protein [Candidatus Peribacteraceae bacterium]
MRLPLSVSVISMSLLLAGSAVAAPFVPKINTPTSYKDVRFGLNELRENIDSVQCGGWDEDTNAGVTGTGVSGYVPIPEISPDLPGRINTNALGSPTGGLGTRGDFEFPDSAWGYSSACDIYQDNYVDDDLARMKLDMNIKEDGSVEVVAGVGKVDINPHDWCLRMDKATPKYCKRLYDAWAQAAAMIPREDPAAVCPCPEPNDGCPSRPPKRYCFDPPYTFECTGTSTKQTAVTTLFPDAPPQNTTCRTTWRPAFYNKMDECHSEEYKDDDGNTRFKIVVDKGGGHAAIASSYYRHYAQAFMVPAITVTAPAGDNTWQVRAECYEYYKELNDDGTDFDPKFDVSHGIDEQCEFVISTDDEQNPRNPEWRSGDGHDQKETVKPDPSIVQESPRDSRPSPEPWVTDTETNLTLIDMEKLKQRQEDFDDPTDVTGIMGTMLTTKQRGSKTVPKNARTDQFDDSDDRDLSAFFEAQQRELLKMTADPQTRLIMPARFLVGLAEDDPLFQYVSGTVSRSDGTVEITLKAGLEDIGNVLVSFQRIFVAPIQEVRIPVLVPLVSVTEIDARIADWKQWKVHEESAAAEQERTSMASSADPLIDKLMSYRDRAEEVRLMRGALLTYLEKLFDSQKQIREYFANWYRENSDLLLVSAEHAVQRRELKRIWRLLQRSMLQADECQMLWCSNHRYSTPVYSLLDNWWGESGPGQKRDRDYQPESLTDLGYTQPDDQLYDFSDVKFPRDPWLIPTLWPVSVAVRLPLPPLVGEAPPSADTFPDLPALPDDMIFDAFPVPNVDLPTAPLITPPVTQDLEPAKDILRAFRTMIDGTDIGTQMAEEASLAAGASIDGGDDNFPLDRGNMRGAYCRFPSSIIIPPNEDQGNGSKIVHVENDLKERLARLFSRWMPEREEDYAGRVARRTQDFGRVKPPCHEGMVCYLLPPEMRMITTWQWFMPNVTGGNFTNVGNTLRNETLPDSESENPYINASVETLKRIFPKFDLPITTKLEIPTLTP